MSSDGGLRDEKGVTKILGVEIVADERALVAGLRRLVARLERATGRVTLAANGGAPAPEVSAATAGAPVAPILDDLPPE